MTTLADPLHEPLALPADAVARYRADGFVRLPGALDPAAIARHRGELARLVAERARGVPPLASRGTYGQAFLQVTNLWEMSAAARAFVLGRRLARAAAELMGVRGVRIYHDQALFKEPGGGFTPWHADQSYWPLATANAVTAWIPLVDVPPEMGPLAFAAGSHRCAFGRELLIGDESEALLARTLRDLPWVEEPFALGDVSFHAGWTYHRAGPNRTARMREVMTIIYIEDGCRIAEPASDAQRSDLREWLPGAAPGGPAVTPRNPLAWSAGG